MIETMRLMIIGPESAPITDPTFGFSTSGILQCHHQAQTVQLLEQLRQSKQVLDQQLLTELL